MYVEIGNTGQTKSDKWRYKRIVIYLYDVIQILYDFHYSKPYNYNFVITSRDGILMIGLNWLKQPIRVARIIIKFPCD